MAIVNFCRQRTQSKGALRSVLNYVLKESKTKYEDWKFVSGQDCFPDTAYDEFMTTKHHWKKSNGVFFYHFIQSFHPDEELSVSTCNQIGLELAKEFDGYEVLVATHVDTAHLHNHLIVNSVSHTTGKKLHQNKQTLMELRDKSDEICHQFGLTVLPPPRNKKKSKAMGRGEYEAARRQKSWKFELICAVEQALLYSSSRDGFIQNMELEGYGVRWTDTRKYITYTCPNGMKCRDNRLHDDTYLKENLELLFAFRQEFGHIPLTSEPDHGWLWEAEYMENLLGSISGIVSGVDNNAVSEPLFAPSDSVLKQRERIKKLAQGHKLESEAHYHGGEIKY